MTNEPNLNDQWSEKALWDQSLNASAFSLVICHWSFVISSEGSWVDISSAGW